MNNTTIAPAGTDIGTPAGSEPGGVLQRLLRFPPNEHWVVSCYLRLEPADRVRAEYFRTLRARVQVTTRSLGVLPRAAQQGIHHDLERLEQHVRHPTNVPHAPAAAVYVCGEVDLFEVVPLPRVHRTRVIIDHTPFTREMVAAFAEFGRVITAVVDRTKARFFEVNAFGATEVAALTALATRGGKFHTNHHEWPGWGEHSYHNRIARERERHYEAVARQLVELDRKRAHDAVVLGGIGREPEAIARFLPAPLARRLAGTTKLNPTAVTPAQLHRATMDVAARHARDRARAAVQELGERLGAGWAVVGVRPTLRALSRGQVRTLLVPEGSFGAGFRCTESGELTLSGRECTGRGDAVAVADVIDEAVEEALRQSVAVIVVEDADDGGSLNGLGALLRFK